ncbi:Sec-independent protein translocase protein TatB [uncultured Hyphomonas sp.]|uniref:Sec-independent protein translocase protein TatB n=1 Tax=uncultured Hyphomonas sp. TaxID=225298 RepID=UPI002AAA6846|nr:Sec-independent protein translocase protein TatB [uncultured Hyphomonas sp.]
MLPGLGFTELMVLAIAALIIVGPKDLPMMMRRLGQFVGKGRAMAREFQAAFDDIARQSELEDLRKEIEELKISNSLKQATSDLTDYEKDVNSAVMAQSRSEAAGTAAKASDAEPPAKPPEANPDPEAKPQTGPEPEVGTEPKGDPA